MRSQGFSAPRPNAVETLVKTDPGSAAGLSKVCVKSGTVLNIGVKGPLAAEVSDVLHAGKYEKGKERANQKEQRT